MLPPPNKTISYIGSPSGCIKFQIPSPFGKLFKRGGKKGRIIGKKEKKRRKKRKKVKRRKERK